MKKIILAFITSLSLLFTACDSKEETKMQSSSKEIIKVGTSGSYFPFTYFENDELKGFEIDVWNAIANKMGMKVEFETSKFSGLFGMLETSKIDTISNQITMTDKRKAKYDFAHPYVYDGAQIIVHKENNSIKSLDDLKGKKVGVGLGTNYAQIIKEYDKNNEIEVITYDGNGYLQDVKLKRINAYIEDRTSAVESIKKGKLPLKLAGEPIKIIVNSFPFLRNEKNAILLEKVNNAIDKLRKEGVLKEISMKWFNTNITEK